MLHNRGSVCNALALYVMHKNLIEDLRKVHELLYTVVSTKSSDTRNLYNFVVGRVKRYSDTICAVVHSHCVASWD